MNFSGFHFELECIQIFNDVFDSKLLLMNVGNVRTTYSAIRFSKNISQIKNIKNFIYSIVLRALT
jgi:hypothetical protein